MAGPPDKEGGRPHIDIWCTCLGKGGKFDEIVLGDRLEMAANLAPCGEAADDHERVESFFPQ